MVDWRMKDFIIVGNMNAITYKDVFPLIKENKIWTGFNFNKTSGFVLSNDYKKWDRTENGQKIGKVNSICWFTNLPVTDKEPLALTARYSPEKYPKYDNYDAIEVGALKDIPFDYSGVIGVPITFLDKYCPEQFEILDTTERWSSLRTKKYTLNEFANANDLNATWVVMENGIPKTGYKRLLIRKRSPNS